MGSFFVNMKQKKSNGKDEPFVKILIARMQQLRNERGYSQEYVIENTHLDISRYETGDSIPTLRSLLKLCKLYDITVSEFSHRSIIRRKKNKFSGNHRRCHPGRIHRQRIIANRQHTIKRFRHDGGTFFTIAILGLTRPPRQLPGTTRHPPAWSS